MATYGALTGYEPTPQPGLYNFKTRDGRSIPIFGAQAEALKARLDEANALMPKPTAQAALGSPDPGAGLDLAGSGIEAQDFVAPAGGFKPNAFGGEQPTTVAAPPATAASAPLPSAPPASIARPAKTNPEPQYVGVFRKNDGTVVQFRVGADPNNPMPGDIREVHPGSRGSKGGLALASQSIRGGFEPSGEYLAGKELVLRERAQQIEGLRQAASENFEAEQALLQDERVRQNDALVERQNEMVGINAAVTKAQADRDEALKDYTSAKVDPRRMFSGGRNWMYGFFAGLSTFGAGLSKTPNYGVQILQQRIADDIAAQETEIKVKRDAADNALTDLTRRLGSQDRAKIALAQAQNQLAQNSLAQAASREKDADKRAGFEAMRVELADKWLELNEQYRVSSLGEVSEQFINRPGTDARGPSVTLPTAESVGAVKSGLAPQLKPSETGKEAPKKDATTQRYENTLTAAERTLNDFVEARGGKRNPETGEITGNLQLPTDWPGPDSPDVSSAKSTLTSLGMVYANMQNAGAEAGQPTKEALTPGIGVTDEPTGPIEAMSREIALRKQQVRQEAEAQGVAK